MTDDFDLILLAAGAGCSLDSSPKKNWVENSGGLPNYICKIAKAVMKSGKSKSSAIAIAVSRTKKWAAGGGDVDADTKAKAAKALAEWNALKAKNKARQVVSASRADDTGYLMLSNISSFNTEMVRVAWNTRERALREAAFEKKNTYGDSSEPVARDYYPYTYIKELWTDHILIEVEDKDGMKLANVPYTVADNGDVEFGEAKAVEIRYVEMDDELTDMEAALLGDIIDLSNKQESPLDKIMSLTRKV